MAELKVIYLNHSNFCYVDIVSNNYGIDSFKKKGWALATRHVDACVEDPPSRLRDVFKAQALFFASAASRICSST